MGEMYSFVTIFPFLILSNKYHGSVMPLFPLEGDIVQSMELLVRIMQLSLSLHNCKLVSSCSVIVYFPSFRSWRLPIYWDKLLNPGIECLFISIISSSKVTYIITKISFKLKG